MLSANEKLTAQVVSSFLAGNTEESLNMLNEIISTKFFPSRNIIFYEFYKNYFESNLQLDPNLLKITIKLVSARRRSIKNYHLNELLSTHFAAFSIEQLEEILEALGEENLNRDPLYSPVLLSTLIGDVFKLQFYLENKYVIPDEYKTVHVSYYLYDHGDKSFHFDTYTAMPKHEGARLKSVLIEEYPELYLTALQLKYKLVNC